MAGQVVISGALTGLPAGSLSIGPLTITANSNNVIFAATYSFVMGANTINVPQSFGALIQPDPSNTVAWTLKGVTGDTGIAISHQSPTLLSWPSSPPGTFVLTAASNFVTETSILFF